MSALWIEVIGLLAATSTLAAFSCRRMMSLRVAAILANVFFIIYASELHLRPVLYLHCLLLPMNIMRLAQCLRAQRPTAAGEGRS
jgi:hypothetical protein